MTKKAIEALAKRLARDLFTNGSQERAQRLVLTVDHPKQRDLGGWGESAAAYRIFTLLSKELGTKS